MGRKEALYHSCLYRCLLYFTEAKTSTEAFKVCPCTTSACLTSKASLSCDCTLPLQGRHLLHDHTRCTTPHRTHHCCELSPLEVTVTLVMFAVYSLFCHSHFAFDSGLDISSCVCVFLCFSFSSLENPMYYCLYGPYIKPYHYCYDPHM